MESRSRKNSEQGISSLTKLLSARAKEKPDFGAYTFLRDGEDAVTITYGELDRRARATAGWLCRVTRSD